MRLVHTTIAVSTILLLLPKMASAAPQETTVCVDVLVREPAKPAVGAAPHSSARSQDPARSAPQPGTSAAKPANADPAPGTTSESPSAAAGAPPTGMSGGGLPPDSAPLTLAPPQVPAYSPSMGYDTASGTEQPAQPAPASDVRAESGAQLPVGQAPEVYLKRLFEHYVTHEQGFVSASEQCSQRVVVELYPLQVGWAAFARYTGNGREERVDQLLPTELSQFAQRATIALLHDKSIAETMDRDNVLWADSLHSTERIRGRNHFVLGVGTRLRAGYFDTAITDSSAANVGSTERKLRLFSPMLIMSGYRGVFDQYGVEALGQFEVGTNAVAAKKNPAGGHVDQSGAVGLALHVMRYTDARGISSFYYGAGATFELGWFRGIKPEADRQPGNTSTTLYGGGLDVDLLAGYEFMRASAVSFYLQGELNLPAYMLKSEDEAATLNTWFPGAKLALGANF